MAVNSCLTEGGFLLCGRWRGVKCVSCELGKTARPERTKIPPTPRAWRRAGPLRELEAGEDEAIISWSSPCLPTPVCFQPLFVFLRAEHAILTDRGGNEAETEAGKPRVRSARRSRQTHVEARGSSRARSSLLRGASSLPRSDS